MLELILVSARSNSHLELLNTFLSCDALIPEVGDDDILDEKHDKKIYSDISKYILQSVDRGDAAPGKISLSYLKQKHGLVHDKFIRVLLDVMLTRQYIPEIKWLDDEILDLKIKWGSLKISSSRLPKILQNSIKFRALTSTRFQIQFFDILLEKLSNQFCPSQSCNTGAFSCKRGSNIIEERRVPNSS